MSIDQWFDAISDLSAASRDGKPKPVEKIAELYREAGKLGLPTECLAMLDENWGM